MPKGEADGRLAQLPSEIRALISGKTVRIDAPHRFYPKLWAIRKRMLGEDVKDVGENTFKLEDAAFREFIAELRAMMIAPKADSLGEQFQPSDWIALALCKLENPNSEDEIPLGEWKMLRWPNGTSRVRQRSAGSCGKAIPESEKLAMKVFFADTDDGPDLEILVRGNPLQILDSERGASQEETRRLLAFLSREIARALQLKSRPGRPLNNFGHLAAWLKDHAGLSWGQISVQTRKTKDNCRKQAKQYWERERRKCNR